MVNVLLVLGFGVNVAGIQFWVALDQFVHLLSIVELFSLSTLVLDLFLHNHDVVLTVSVLKVVIVTHFEPGMLQHLLSSGSVFMVLAEHG